MCDGKDVFIHFAAQSIRIVRELRPGLPVNRCARFAVSKSRGVGEGAAPPICEPFQAELLLFFALPP